MSRLNKVIAQLENNQVAFAPFIPSLSPQDAVWAANSPYDGIIYELEHTPLDLSGLRVALQFLLDRKQIAERGIAPAVVPLVRIPVNGRENNQWLVKQVLDIGVYGIIFPMINTVDDAWHALRASRYIQAKGALDQEPVGMRGHAPNNAVRYWGLTPDEYYDKADVWPLDPQGEILPILQCETAQGIVNLPDILRAIKQPGVILISEGDLSVSLGYKGNPHPEVDAAVQQAAQTCREFGVIFGSPQVTVHNIAQRIADGFRFLMPAARDLATLTQGLKLTGRTA